MERQKSIVEYFYKEDEGEGHRCGYCKSSDSNITEGGKTGLPSIITDDNIIQLK
jgi:hypothetical protein